jgi:hypothetical protein
MWLATSPVSASPFFFPVRMGIGNAKFFDDDEQWQQDYSSQT